ncbi:MAG: thioesterase family protein [Acidimicrobiales bacterium]
MTDTSQVDALLDQLGLEELDVDLYRGHNPAERHNQRVFGGLVAAQALRAATLTIEVDHHPHSLHGYFLRGGKPGRPIVYHVERIRDGRSFSTRRVVGKQYGVAIFNLTASFHTFEEDETDYQLSLAADAGHPDDATDRVPRDDQHAAWLARSPFHSRELGPTTPGPDGVYSSTRRVWVKAKSPLPNDRLLHACALTYATDMGAVTAAAVAKMGDRWQTAFTETMSASLDHAVWFHRPVRVDEWLYFDVHAVSNQNSRGLVRGTIHAIDGSLVASFSQEALIRTIKPRALDPEFG